jgi:hypothetical protein
LAILIQNKAKLFKSLIITLVFEKSANFFAENCQKSPEIVIITSTPGFWKFCGTFVRLITARFPTSYLTSFKMEISFAPNFKAPSCAG